MKNKLKTSTNDLRRRRTRTMIQAGGLLEKSGILSYFGIRAGDDLQQDDTLQENVSELFGALLEIKSMIRHNDPSTTLWKQKGKEGLAS